MIFLPVSELMNDQPSSPRLMLADEASDWPPLVFMKSMSGELRKNDHLELK